MADPASLSDFSAAGFPVLRLLLAVFGLLVIVFWFSNFYSRQVSLPRYCEQLEQSLQRLNAINTQSRPAGDKSRRDYIIAAKLEFLLPKAADEPLDAYIRRLGKRLRQQCQ